MRTLLLFFACLSISNGFEEIFRQIVNRRRLPKLNLANAPEELDARGFISRITQNAAEFSQECQEDMVLLGESALLLAASLRLGSLNLTDFDVNVVLPILDASAKPGSGILHGRNTFTGLYPECVGINYALPNRNRPFRADYFRLFLDQQLRKNTEAGACTSDIAGTLVATSPFIGFDICLPKSCSSDELRPYLQGVGGNGTAVCAATKAGDHIPERHPMFYVTIALMAGIVIVCVLSGVVDYYLTPILKHKPIAKSFGYNVFMSFSLYRNISQIAVTNTQNQEGVIGPIHCLRFFSMCWVVMGHMLVFELVYATNPVDLMAIIPDLTTEVLTNAFFAVDTFFFMSGLLLSFIWFKNYKKNPKQTMSLPAWTMVYVHRYIRLSAPYFVALFFYTWVFPHMKPNSPRNMQPAYPPDTCTSYWWTNVLYLNNYLFYTKGCFSVSWYLAADMQMFVFSPLLLIPLALHQKVGLFVSAVVLALSTAANFITMYVFKYPPTLLSIGPNDPDLKMDDYFLYIYSAPYVRCQVYVIGLLVGYLLQTKRSIRINKFLSLILWGVAVALMLTVLLGLHNYQNQTYLPIFWRAAYTGLSRVAWGIGLAWIIIACYYGYGGPINEFMSWHIWAPLGRLTYCGYLLHWIVIDYLAEITTNDITFSNFLDLFVTRVIPGISVTFFISLFWSACFEVSIGKVEGLLLGGHRRVADAPEKKKEEVWADTDDVKGELRL